MNSKRRTSCIHRLSSIWIPDSDYSLKAFRTMVEHGVDAVEIGLPYSDPVMDGPVIQAASQIAIDNGEKIANVFKASKPWPTPGESLW